ncbi:MAG: hypothetical protein ABIP17_02840 [Ilumatobacteraceae bacterium]
MGELVLLVVAAAWAAVLIPPLLRSRIENRPNSSVTDFRRQLNRLQSTVPNRATASARGGMARPLAQSPLHRPAAAGRPGIQAAQIRRGGTRAHGAHGGRSSGQVREASARQRPAVNRQREVTERHRDDSPRRRSHGEAAGSRNRPHHPRQTQVARNTTGDQTRRRRSNVLFMLVLAAGSTLFLAATTKDTTMLSLFAAAFLGLCGYMWMLAQARQREAGAWGHDWMHQ